MDAYVGDNAGVLPDNTAAMLHIHDQFQAQEERRAALQLQQQKADEARRYRLGAYIGNRLDEKHLLSGTAADPNISNMVNDATTKAYQAMRSGADEGDIMSQVNLAAENAASYSAKAKMINQNNATQIAALTKQYPGLDPAALAEVTGHDSFYKDDGKGGFVLKTPDELDPTASINDIVKNHFDKVVKPGVEMASEVKKAGLQPVGAPSVYDPSTGKRTTIGYKGKVPTSIYGLSQDDKGNATAEARHEEYKLPDGTLYIDPTTRQPVKVIAPDLFDKWSKNPAIVGEVDNDVKQQIKQINDVAAANGKPPVTDNGPLADMLRRKKMYDMAQAQNNFQLIPDADKTFSNVQRIKAGQRADQRLAISKQIFSLNKQKYADGKVNPDIDVPLLTDELDTKAGENIIDSAGTAVRFINVKNIDANDLQTIQGDAKTPKDYNGEQKPLIQPTTIKTQDGKTITGFAVNQNGDLIGDGGQVIDKNVVQTNALNDVKKETLKVAPITKRTVVQKVVDRIKKAIAPTSKIKGTDKPLY